MTHGPVQEQHREMMQKVGQALADSFPGYGFCLLVFELDSKTGRINYLCNAERKDMIAAMKEFIANAEGRGFPPPKEKM